MPTAQELLSSGRVTSALKSSHLIHMTPTMVLSQCQRMALCAKKGVDSDARMLFLWVSLTFHKSFTSQLVSKGGFVTDSTTKTDRWSSIINIQKHAARTGTLTPHIFHFRMPSNRGLRIPRSFHPCCRPCGFDLGSLEGILASDKGMYYKPRGSHPTRHSSRLWSQKKISAKRWVRIPPLFTWRITWRLVGGLLPPPQNICVYINIYTIICSVSMRACQDELMAVIFFQRVDILQQKRHPPKTKSLSYSKLGIPILFILVFIGDSQDDSPPPKKNLIQSIQIFNSMVGFSLFPLKRWYTLAYNPLMDQMLKKKQFSYQNQKSGLKPPVWDSWRDLSHDASTITTIITTAQPWVFFSHPGYWEIDRNVNG